MTISVIDLFKVIQIEHHHGHGTAIALSMDKLCFCQFKEMTTVGHASEHIGPCKTFKFHLGPFTICDIHKHNHVTQHLAALITNGRNLHKKIKKTCSLGKRYFL